MTLNRSWIWYWTYTGLGTYHKPIKGQYTNCARKDKNNKMKYLITITLHRNGSSWPQPTTSDSDFSRLWTTPDDSGRLQTTPKSFKIAKSEKDESGQFRTTPDNTGRTYLLESILNLSESNRSRLWIFANLAHHYSGWLRSTLDDSEWLWFRSTPAASVS